MKKKGFTLVELLAVIAILAILVIIALPNIMGMFNNAKKNTFLTEIKNIYRGAEQAYVQDAFNSSGARVYSKCSSGCTNPLDMSVKDDLEYYIEINSQGKVVKYYAHDNSYQFKHDGEMSINDIDDAQDISNLNEDEIIVIDNKINYKYVYAFPYREFYCYEGQPIPDGVMQYDNYEDLVNASGHNVFIRYALDNNKIVETYAGFIKGGNVYYIRGGQADLYEENKAILKSIFGYDCREDEYHYSCSISRLRIGISTSGETGVGDPNIYCPIYTSGGSMCY